MVTIIGILAGVAIPVFMNQKAKARDVAASSDLASIAKVIASLDQDGPLARSGDGTGLYVAGARVAEVTPTNGVAWNVSGNAQRFCLTAYAESGSKHTVTQPLTFDSGAGGLGRSGAACPSSSESLPMAFPVNQGGPLGGINVIPDSTLRRDIAPTIQNSEHIAPYFNATLATVDVTTPVGNRALSVTSRTTAQWQGVIFFQAPNGQVGTLVSETGEVWAGSLWVKGAAGTEVCIGTRITHPGWNVTREPCGLRTLTGEWQRLTFTFTATEDTVGQQPALQVRGTIPVGESLHVAGPQLERSSAVSAFQPTLPR